MSSRDLLLLLLGLGLVGTAYLSAFLPGDPPGWAPWAFAVGTSAAFTAFLALGARRSGKLGWLA